MQDERNRLCRHIRAAREWLGQAEDSLKAEQDVQGDLKLLLARAELQHVHEKRRLMDMGKRVLFVVPLFLVLLLVAGNRFQSTEPEAPLADRVLPSAEMQAGTIPLQEQEQMGVPEAVPEESTKSSPAGFLPEPEAVVQPSSTDAVQEKPVQEDSIPEPVVREEQAVPSRDMQKLMQSAGSVLRAQ